MAGFRGSIDSKPRVDGFFYRNTQGVETMLLPRWLVITVAAFATGIWCTMALIVGLFANSVLYKLEAVEAYQAATQAKCAQAIGAQERK